MNRATALAVAITAALRAAPAAAQRAGKTYRVGLLLLDSRSATRHLQTFRDALGVLGYREGQNLAFVVRSADGDPTRLPALARALVQARPDVIVAGNYPTTAALKRATSSVPIVMASVADPVGAGLVAALDRPGGNLTGLSNMGFGITGKQLQLLTEVGPHLSLLVILDDPSFPAPARDREAERNAERVGLQSVVVGLGSPSALDRVVKPLPPGRIGVLASVVSAGNIPRVTRLMAERRLPAIYYSADSVERGGLMSYGQSEAGIWRQVAGYVDRILKSAKPADLPVQQPTTFGLAVNLKAAREIGITVPQSILVQATQVIR